MRVYQIKVSTAWNSPGSTGDPNSRGMCAHKTTTYFIEARTVELAIKHVNEHRGCQDDKFEIESVTLIEGQAHVVNADKEEDSRWKSARALTA